MLICPGMRFTDPCCLCNYTRFAFVGLTAPSVGDDGRSAISKPPGEMLVAQAWWDAAYNATTAERQSPARLGLGQGAPGVPCAVGITGMQDDSAGRAAATLSSTTTMEVGIDIGALRAEPPGLLQRPDTFYVGNLKGVSRVYQQTFIDASAVARPPPSQAPGAQLAEATTPLPLACRRIISRISSAVMSPRKIRIRIGNSQLYGTDTRMLERHNLARNPGRILQRIVHNPKIAEPA